MSTAITAQNQNQLQIAKREALETRIALNSNLWGMQDSDVWQYYRQMCDYLGIDAVSHPFDVITDQKAQTKRLYPNSICTAQLGEKRKYSYSQLQISINDDLLKLGFKVAHVSLTVTAPDGRSLVSEAFVDLMSGYEGQLLKGNNLTNALKKAGTQCRRRGTLQMAGLALPSDEIPIVKLGDIERSDSDADSDADGVVIEHPPVAALLGTEQTHPDFQSDFAEKRVNDALLAYFVSTKGNRNGVAFFEGMWLPKQFGEREAEAKRLGLITAPALESSDEFDLREALDERETLRIEVGELKDAAKAAPLNRTAGEVKAEIVRLTGKDSIPDMSIDELVNLKDGLTSWLKSLRNK